MTGACSLWIAALSLFAVGLGSRVALMRRNGVSEGRDEAIRAHANLVENAPLFCVLLLGADLLGGAPGVVHSFGAVFVAARLWHAWGLSSSLGRTHGRFYGIAVTWSAMAALAVWVGWLGMR